LVHLVDDRRDPRVLVDDHLPPCAAEGSTDGRAKVDKILWRAAQRAHSSARGRGVWHAPTPLLSFETSAQRRSEAVTGEYHVKLGAETRANEVGDPR